jgi:hypothetical protein
MRYFLWDEYSMWCRVPLGSIPLYEVGFGINTIYMEGHEYRHIWGSFHWDEYYIWDNPFGMNALDEVVHLGMNTVISEVVPLGWIRYLRSSLWVGMNSLNEVVHLGMNTVHRWGNSWSPCMISTCAIIEFSSNNFGAWLCTKWNFNFERFNTWNFIVYLAPYKTCLASTN